MLIRALGSSFSEVVDDLILSRAIPAYCFGLLNVRFSQAWDDSTAALKHMAENQEGESIIADIAFRLLSDPRLSSEESSTKKTPVYSGKTYVTEFQCSNLLQLNEEVQKSIAITEKGEDFLYGVFLEGHSAQALTNDMTRSNALRILKAIPRLAEKRSRIMVPILLKWGCQTNTPDFETLADDPESTIKQLDTSSERWTRKELKDLLELFAQFINPKVLYRSDDVYACALRLPVEWRCPDSENSASNLVQLEIESSYVLSRESAQSTG